MRITWCMPPSGSHLMRTTNGAQAHLQLRLYLWAPEKRARIVSRLGERTVRIHMDAHPTALVPFQSVVRFFGLSPEN